MKLSKLDQKIDDIIDKHAYGESNCRKACALIKQVILEEIKKLKSHYDDSYLFETRRLNDIVKLLSEGK